MALGKRCMPKAHGASTLLGGLKTNGVSEQHSAVEGFT